MTSTKELSNIRSALDKAERQIQSGHNFQDTINLLSPLLDKLRRSKQTDYLMESLSNMGVCYFELGQLSKARVCLEEGLNIARTNANQSLMSHFLHELSLVAFREGKLPDSLNLCSEALSLGLEADEDVGNTVLHMAVLYQMLRKFSEAEEILRVICVNCERNFDVVLLARILNEKGLVEFQLGNYQEGVRSFINSINYKSILNDNQGIQKSLHNLQTCLMLFPSAKADPEVKRIIDRIKR